MDTVACPGCGGIYENRQGTTHAYIGASPGCMDVYTHVLAREYENFRALGEVHRLTVDTYAVQHPGEPGRRQAQSVTLHLVSLYLVIERGIEAPAATRAIGRLSRRKQDFGWIEPPSPNGTFTIGHVAGANMANHASRVTEWAADVYRCWAHAYPAIRELADEAFA